MLIQVVGLPCSGKSTTIKSLSSIYDFIHLDKKNMHSCAVFNDFKQKIKADPNKIYIIESACGFESPESIVVLLRVPKSQLKKQTKMRNEKFTEHDYEQLNDQIIAADYTAYSTKELLKTLKMLLKG